MIRILRDINYTVAKTIFQNNFFTTEDPYFKEAWDNRSVDRSFGLWKEGCLIGLAIVCDTKLDYICIDPAAQGCGWGSILLQHVLSVCPTLYLNPADDPLLCKWYERHGFQLSNERVYPKWTRRCYVRHAYDTRSKARKN
jgi:GNAT superfamily N-acetyltransferase